MIIRGTSLAILALLVVVVLTTVIVSAAPRQQTVYPLSALTLSGVTLVPAFDPATITYTATVPYTVDETTITTTANAGFTNNSITLSGTTYTSGDALPLAYGENAIVVGVINMTTFVNTNYSVTVTRPQPIAERTIDSSTVAPGESFTVTMDWSPAAGAGKPMKPCLRGSPGSSSTTTTCPPSLRWISTR